MKKVSVFTVLTCFLAGTANLSYCYAGNSWFGGDDEARRREQPKSPTSAGRGAGRGALPTQQPMSTPSAGRGAGRGALSTQQPTSIEQGSRGSMPSAKPKPGPNLGCGQDDSQIPQFEGTFDDVDSAVPPSNSETPQLTPAELAMVTQLVKDGKLSGISLKSDSSQSAVPSAHGSVGGERVEQLSRSTMPSPHATPLPTTSLVSNGDAETSGTSKHPTSSSSVMDNEESKDDTALSHYIPYGYDIIQKENYRLTKVPLVCSLTEWKFYSASARNEIIKKLYEPSLVQEESRLISEDPKEYIKRLGYGVRWVKHYLTEHGKRQNKEKQASDFSQLIQHRLNNLIKEVEEQVRAGKQLSDLSIIIRFLHLKAENKFFFSVEKRLGEVILGEIPGQEL